MNNQTIQEEIEKCDANPKRQGPVWDFVVEDHQVIVITDTNADRMRIMSPIAETEKLSPELLVRSLQANFDSALDARYAIAHDTLWSVFIHPLGSLTEHDFRSGIAQVVTAARTYGTSFSSGALLFGGGDSQNIQEQLYWKIMNTGKLKN